MPMTHTTPSGIVYYKGHVRAPNKDHLIDLSHRRHVHRLRALHGFQTPDSYDSQAATPACIPTLEDVDDNQASCGSCWDFSGTEVVEVALMLAGVLRIDQRLSKQYTLSCGQNGGCNGDDNTNVLEWAKKTGIPLSADYGPYTGSSGTCNFKPSMNLYKIDDWGFCDSSGGQGVTPVQDIKNAIIAYRRVGCAVAAGGDSFWNDGQGIGSGTSHSIDHDVALDGWQDTGTKVTAAIGSGVLLPSSSTPIGWWWMTNSWGPKWGVNGRAKVAYGAYDIGTEAVFAVVHGGNPPIDWGNL